VLAPLYQICKKVHVCWLLWNRCSRDSNWTEDPRELHPGLVVVVLGQADEHLVHPLCGSFQLHTQLRASLVGGGLERMSVFGQYSARSLKPEPPDLMRSGGSMPKPRCAVCPVGPNLFN
jgi:hypothetical protein